MNCDMYSFITVILAGKWQNNRAISSHEPFHLAAHAWCTAQRRQVQQIRHLAISQMQQLSSYAATLGSEALKRYKEKIALIGGLDPFSAALGKPVDHVPPLEASDIVSYLILQTSFITISLFVDGSRMSVPGHAVCGSYLTVDRVSTYIDNEILHVLIVTLMK